MAITYEPIATTTLSSTAASVTFSSIPQNYTDLVLVGVGYNASGDFYSPIMRFNSDSSGNYSRTRLVGDGSSAGSARFTNQNDCVFSGTGWRTSSTSIGDATAHIMNYSNSTTYKTVLTRSSLAESSVYTDVNLWRNTNAITQIQLLVAASGTFASGSTFTLYGIKAA